MIEKGKDPKTDAEKKETLQLEQKPIFQGTSRRNIMMQNIIQMCREKLPMNQKQFINIVAFNTGLTTRKVTEDYIDVLISVGVLQCNKFDYELGRNSGSV